MFDDTGLTMGSLPNAACIRLNDDHRDWCRAVLLLEAAGGQRDVYAVGGVYRFITSVARDDALRLMRSRFGSTAATAFDRHPRLPAGSSTRNTRA